MAWLQLQIKATAENAEFISNLLMTLGSEAITLLDAKDQPLLEPGPNETPLWDEAWVSALFSADTQIDLILQQLKILLEKTDIISRVIPLPDKNWTREWLEHFKPMQFGKKLWVTPVEFADRITANDAVIVLLDPGLAFGTGTHPTTALCLEWLDKVICPGQVVIDYGCGSGILAIAAAKLGAATVYAIDNDPQALTATIENANRNKLSKNQLIALTPDAMPSVHADILVANILANPLVSLVPTFAEHLKSQGLIALSGILADQIDMINSSYSIEFNLEKPIHQGEWVLMAGKKK